MALRHDTGTVAIGREDIFAVWNNMERAVKRVEDENLGEAMMSLMKKLFPLPLSLTGNGVRQAFDILSEVAVIKRREIPTGYQAFDWKVPREWNIQGASIRNSRGETIVDLKNSNLHVLNYSIPYSGRLTLEELRPHLFTNPDQPDAIPYVTSYYREQWGFCLSQRQLDSLPDDVYEVFIDSRLSQGSLTLADAVIPGFSDREILFSTYICHPSQADDNLSGVVLTAFLCNILSPMKLRYTYRFVFVPETIGAIVYLHQEGDHLRKKLHAGYVLTCVGDPGPYTYKRSLRADTIADRAAEHCLGHLGKDGRVNIVDFFPSGSDETQYCSPGFALPVGSLMRSRYQKFPEYHSSLDNMNFVKPDAMADSLRMCLRIIQALELNDTFLNRSPYCEPHLSKHKLYPTIGAGQFLPKDVERTRYLLAYSNGERDLISIASSANQPVWSFAPQIEALVKAGLLGTAS